MPKIGEKRKIAATENGDGGEPLKPFWTTADGELVKLYQGDAVETLSKLPEKSVHCVVTSPPYWALRDYGTALWEGGSEDCDHKHENRGQVQYLDRNGKPGSNNTNWQGAKNHSTVHLGDACKKCGATRIDKQLGSEKTPEEFVAAMVRVFAEVHRVLRDDGTLWLNLGDSYASTGGASRVSDKSGLNHGRGVRDGQKSAHAFGSAPTPSGLKSGNLVGIPWRVALALQAYGWILRQDIIWAKPSPMPESVKNRCTKSHEYIFLFAKRSGYYYDAEAVREGAVYPMDLGILRSEKHKVDWHTPSISKRQEAGIESKTAGTESRNKRSVWSVASEPYEGSHFACFPRKLIEPCILAGSSEHGCCSLCGAPYKRVTESLGYTKKDTERSRGNAKVGENNVYDQGSDINKTGGGSWVTKTLCWEASCSCSGADVIPCTVLDPFIGSGTSCVVSIANGRRSIGIDLNPVYLRNNAIPRIEGALLSIPELSSLTGRIAERMDDGEDLDDSDDN